MAIPNKQAITTWLWMKAAAYGLEQVENFCRRKATPSEDDRRVNAFSETCRKSYQYALDHWDQVAAGVSALSGASCGHGRYYLGYDVTVHGKRVTAKFRDTEVTITLPEIKQMIEYMLTSPEMEERQLTMFEMLAEKAGGTE